MNYRVFVPDEPVRFFHDRVEAENLVRSIETGGLRVQTTPVVGLDDLVVAVEYRFHRP